MNIALITAGGVGNRMGQDIPKQFMTIENCPVIIYTLQSFQNSPRCNSCNMSKRMGSYFAIICQSVYDNKTKMDI